MSQSGHQVEPRSSMLVISDDLRIGLSVIWLLLLSLKNVICSESDLSKEVEF